MRNASSRSWPTFDDRIDELEDEIFREASDQQLREIFQMKRLLVGMRKAVSPQGDAFAGLMGGVACRRRHRARHARDPARLLQTVRLVLMRPSLARAVTGRKAR
jgi:Mg2+ and Co2+ transporter CorA